MMKNIILLLLVGMSFSSCNEWLNVESEKSVTYQNYFKNEQEVEAIFTTIMSNMRLAFAPVTVTPRHATNLQATYYSLLCEPYVKLDPIVYTDKGLINDWLALYKVIGLAQTIIDNESRFKNITEERSAYWIAQCNFVKAMCYFRIAQMWGDAPIVTSSEQKEALVKSTAAEVLNEAERCAEKALTLPQWNELRDSYKHSITQRQWGSLGTVKTLLAYLYAWRAGVIENKREYWAKAEAYASQVIEGKVGQYALEPSVEQVVTGTLGEARSTTEVIFSIANPRIDNEYSKSYFLYYFYPGQILINYPHTTSDAYQLEYSDEGFYNCITEEDVYALYPDSKDKRLKEYWFQLGEKGLTFAFLNKWRDKIMNGSASEMDRMVVAFDGDIVIWRLADLQLLRAEIRTRLSQPNAVDDLNVIRRRAGLEDYAGSTDPEQLRREVFNERQRELFGEGQRYWDIVRNGYWAQELQGAFKTLTAQNVKDGALYLPVPVNAFLENTLMTQNKYWQWKN